MTLHCAFIGFGSAPPATIFLTFCTAKTAGTWRISIAVAKPEEQAPQYSHIHFTSDLDEVLNDPQVRLVIVCTHADSHFDYAKRALKRARTCWWKNPSPRRWWSKALFALAKSKGLTVTPYQNRRFDSCFLTAKKAIESGKLGEIVEIESHFDLYRPVAETQPGLAQDGTFYGLGVHTLDQIISCSAARITWRTTSAACVIRPTRMIPFEAQLFYGDLKVIVKTSYLVKLAYPKFIVHGHKGSFIKYGIDQQETSLKANIMPGEPGLRQTIASACWSTWMIAARACAKSCEWSPATTGGCMIRSTRPW